MNWKIVFAAFAMAVSGAVLQADDAAPQVQEIKPQVIKEKDLLAGKVKLDPARGYILSSYPSRYLGTFVRVPDAEDWAAYRADWEKAYVKAQKKYESDYKHWKSEVDIAKSTGNRMPAAPKPLTRETFSIGPIEARLTVGFGPGDEYLKDKSVPIYRYLNAVKPGTYIWYGPFSLSIVGAGGCYCMGTVKFDVKAGVITDLGDFLAAVTHYDGLNMDDNYNRMPDRFSNSPDGMGEAPPELAQYGIPASLSALPGERAQFSAAGKMNNMFNLMVSRVRPIPGIIAYRRGEVIDLRTGKVISAQIAAFDPNAEAGDDDAD